MHNYSVKVVARSPRGGVVGELYEGDLLVAKFRKPALGWYWAKVKFGSERAKARFDDFSDCLSMGETLEALTPSK